MNKSEIYEIAAGLIVHEQKRKTSSQWANEYYAELEIRGAINKLIQAAALLKEMDAELASIKEQVVFVDGNSEPEVGDLLVSTKGVMGGISCGYLYAKSWTPPNEAAANDEYWTIQPRFGDGKHPDKFWANPKEWQTILQRNNQPVLVRK